MWKTNEPSQDYKERTKEAEEELNERQRACADLASEFGDFASDCGGQIWAIVSVAETLAAQALPPDLVCSDQLICLDVLNICSALSRAGGIPDGFPAMFCAIAVRVDPTRFKPEVMNGPAAEGAISDWLSKRASEGVVTPFVVEFLAQHDRMNGGSLANRAASVYSLLVIQLFSLYLPSSLDRPDLVVPAGQVANEYLKLLKVYIEPSETGDRSNTERAGVHSDASDNCSACSDAYDLLELPFGAALDEVKSAQRELARNLHPDVWVNRRGARGAEEQLKQINAARQHLANCRWSVSRPSGKGEGRRQAKESVDPNREFYELGRVQWTQYVKSGKRSISEEQAKKPPSPSHTRSSHHIDRSPSPSYRRDPEIKADSSSAARGGSNNQRFGRIVRVFLRTVWRTTKIIMAILLASIAAAIALLGIFMALWEYWEGQSRAKNGQSSLGSINGRLFSFLESVTWLPRQIWGGLMLVATLLLFGIVFAGQTIGQFASSNSTACMVVVCFSGLGLMVWVFHKEWRAEIAAIEVGEAQPITPLVMGSAVIVVGITACIWLQFSNTDMAKVQGNVVANQIAGPSTHPPLFPKSSESDENSDLAPIPVPQGGLWLLVDDTGRVITTLPSDIRYVAPFSGGVAVFEVEERDPNPDIAEDSILKYQARYGYIDETGKVLLKADFTSAGSFREGFGLVGMNESSAYYHGVSEVTGTRNYVDKQGHMLLSLPGEAFDQAEEDGFSNGLAPMRFAAGWGYLDKNGRLAIPANFVLAEPFSEQLAAVATRLVPGGRSGFATKWGYILPSGVFAIPPVFDSAGRFSEGLAEASKDGTTGFIDRTGRFVIRLPDTMEGEESEFSDNLAVVRIGSKYGAIDRAGNVVISPTYGSLGHFKMGVSIALSPKGTFGAIRSDGAVLIPFEYSEIVPSHDGGVFVAVKYAKEPDSFNRPQAEWTDVFNRDGKILYKSRLNNQ